MTDFKCARDLVESEIAQVAAADIVLPPIVLPWPHGPILTGTGPYGGDPLPDVVRQE